MAEENMTDLAGLLTDKNVLDFVGIAVVAPLVASVIAIITARLGVTGRIKRLELAEKRLDVITALLSKSDLDDDIRTQLRGQMHDITAELISDYGGAAEARFDGREDRDLSGADTLRLAKTNTAWAELPRWRRWLFPPFTKSIRSWVCGIFYYYLSFSMLMFLLGFVLVMTDGTGTDEDIFYALFIFPVMYVFIHLARLGMRYAFNRRYEEQIERRRVADHARVGPRQTA